MINFVLLSSRPYGYLQEDSHAVNLRLGLEGIVKLSRTRLAGAAIAVVLATILLSGCAAFNMGVDNLASLMEGRSATITTYNVYAQQLDRIHGTSVNIQRDTTFDTTNSDGTSNQDSSVLAISVGGHNMTHVGSTLLMVQDGIVDITGQLPPTVDLNNNQRGVPLLNYLRQGWSNLWQGTSRTILVRSQNGSPIAIFGGNEVEYYATDIPKSTLLRIDGKYVLIYRSDYTIYDNALLQ